MVVASAWSVAACGCPAGLCPVDQDVVCIAVSSSDISCDVKLPMDSLSHPSCIGVPSANIIRTSFITSPNSFLQIISPFMYLVHLTMLPLSTITLCQFSLCSFTTDYFSNFSDFLVFQISPDFFRFLRPLSIFTGFPEFSWFLRFFRFFRISNF